MPAVATTSDDDIIQVLKEHPEIFENNHLIKEKNDKWKPIKKKLPNISLHNLYIRVQQNRSCNKRNVTGIQDRLKKIFSYRCELPVLKSVQDIQATRKSIEDNAEVQIPCQTHTYLDEFDIIHQMKYDVNCSHAINSISCKKFEIIYFLQEQLDLFKVVINCKLPIIFIKISNIVDRTKMRCHISELVSYISLSCVMEAQLVTTFAQGLAECVDELFVYNFILRILKSRIPLPSNLVMMYDQEIMNGICTAVNQCTFQEYLSKVYNKIDVPVYLHIDIVSLLIAISNLQHFHSKPKLVKEFYVKCVIQLSLCVNLEDFNKMAKDIFTVMFSSVKMVDMPREKLEKQFNNSNLKEKFKCFESYKKEEYCAYIFTSEIDVNVKTSDETEHHIEEIKSSAISYVNSNLKTTEPNGYYFPELYREFKVVLSYFPSWTNMKDETNYYDLASSSTCSTLHQLNDLNSIPFRASNFLNYHINDVKGLVQKGRTFMDKYKDNHKEIKEYQKHYCLSFEENWMGQNNCNVKLTYNEDTEDHEVQEVDSENQSSMHIQTISTSETTSNSVEKDLFALKQFLPKSTQALTKTDKVKKPQFKPNSSKYLQNNCNAKLISERNPSDYEMELDNSELQSSIHIQDETTSNSAEKDIFSLKQFSLKFTQPSTKTLIVGSQVKPKVSKYLQSNCNVKLIDNKDAVVNGMEVDHLEIQSSVNIQDETASNSVEIDFFKNQQLLPECTQPSTKTLIVSSQVKPKSSIYLQNNSNIVKVINNKVAVEHGMEVDHSKIQSPVHIQDETVSNSVEKDFFKNQQLLPECTQPSTKTIKVKKPQVKPRSRKYLDPCPSMKIIHQQKSTARNKLKEQLLQNESLHGVRKINKKTYALENSSTIDSIMEVVKFSFLNYNDFKTSKDLTCSKFCDDVCIVKCLIDCTTSGRFARFYNTRAKVILKIGSSQGDRISINENVGSIFEKLMKLHYSHEVTGLCIMCDDVFCCDGPILVFPEIDNFTIENLERLVQNYFTNLHIKCDNCSDDCMVSYYFGAYLAIDIEKLQLSMKLDEIPNQIVILNSKLEPNTFVLSGVVGNDGESLNDNVSYCRSVNNFWDKRSNTEKKILKFKKLPLVSLKILFYVKITKH